MAGGERSAALFERARRRIPGGVNSPVRAFRAVGGEPFFVDRAEGARLRDVDGREYVDYVLSWGALLLGHADAEVQRGITLERNEAQVGRELVVLVDRAASEDGAGVAVGRSTRDAVEVDGVVLIHGAADARAGEFVRVRITGADEHELTGDFLGTMR